MSASTGTASISGITVVFTGNYRVSVVGTVFWLAILFSICPRIAVSTAGAFVGIAIIAFRTIIGLIAIVACISVAYHLQRFLRDCLRIQTVLRSAFHA